MKKITTYLIFPFLLLSFQLRSQDLKPGFFKDEYKEMMLISVRSVKSEKYSSEFPAPKNYKMIYQSADMAFDNSWDLWTNGKGTTVISLRGTTGKPESWLENFYAAMVPAKGVLKLNKTENFEYQLAENPRAGVHVGWLVGMAILSKDVLPKIDSLHKNGTKDFIIVGHSQGGAIAFLLTAHLNSLKKLGKLPTDMRFKTYCSAGPKPGNLYFAYEYEAATQNGWAYNVVNGADWVPETPFSIQTVNDFNNTNPFKYAKGLIKKQKFPARMALKHVYKKLSKPGQKAQKNYGKYLGTYTSKMVKKQLPDLEVGDYITTNNYVRTGTTIVLLPTEEYYKVFANDSKDLFNHHFHKPYLLLTENLNDPFYVK